MAKIYAVKTGRKPGIYKTWAECQAQTSGFSGAVFKSFSSLEEAEKYMGSSPEEHDEHKTDDVIMPYAFTDGSFNSATNTYGYGGFLVVNEDEKHPLSGSGNNPEYASSRNVTGEVLGAMAAIEKAIEVGLKDLHIYYDYSGIENWALGNWKANKGCSVMYKEFIDNIDGKIALHFHHVKGHTGIAGNEEADRLAKKAVGVK
jgi:ribonuclease HI